MNNRINFSVLKNHQMIKSPNDTVIVDLKDNVLTITLNRPKVLNALNRDMAEALAAITQSINQKSNIRVVRIEGAGEHFMAGGDLKYFQTIKDNSSDRNAFANRFKDFIPDAQAPIQHLRNLSQPVVASVHGSVAGYGFSLMNACDMVVAANNTVFTIAYSLIGTSPDGGSSWTLPRIVGYRRAFELMALSDRFSAETALQYGLINEIAALDTVEKTVADLVKRLVSAPELAIAETKRLLARSPHQTLLEQLADEEVSFAQCAAHPDFEEGISAFLEKRSPRFNQ